MHDLFSSIPWERLPVNPNDPATVATTWFVASTTFFSALAATRKSIEAQSRRHNNPDIRKKRSLLYNKFDASKVPEDLDYIVIGSGMAGLSCAAMLSRLGRKVLVLEQHPDVLGGGTHMFNLKGFDFDSGLHYTVPWATPLFALTCLKKPKDCVPFDLMTEEDGTIDKICYMQAGKEKDVLRMRYHEEHVAELFERFPHEAEGLRRYMEMSNNAMLFVKYFFIARLLPKWMQSLFWACVPSAVTDTAHYTAQELLPKIIRDKKLISILSSMWIDTGARPDRATFMLTASVFRGISLEGGCYPRGGSIELAKDLVTVVESNGGRCFIKAEVDRVLFDASAQRVSGVRLRNGKEIHCKCGVVSSTGYLNTVNNLVPKDLAEQFHLRRSLPIDQSPGFVMVNIGMACTGDDIGATRANTWHIPLDASGDIFGPMQEYFNDPLRETAPASAFITFPSLKDVTYKDRNPNKTSCQVLVITEFDWFRSYRQASSVYSIGREAREEGYEQLKEVWKQKILKIFLTHFPRAEQYIKVVDISTPLTIEHYLHGVHGGAVGIDVNPARFCDPEIRESLDPITPLPGLALTGQDTAICGVTLCQLSGVITAFRLEGALAAVKAVCQSILLGN